MKDLLEAFHRNADRIKMSSTISPHVTLFARKSSSKCAAPPLFSSLFSSRFLSRCTKEQDHIPKAGQAERRESWLSEQWRNGTYTTRPR